MRQIHRGLWIIAILILGVSHVGGASAHASNREVKVERVGIGFTPNGAALLLQIGEKSIPIFVDDTVAAAIHGLLSGRKFPRPLSHDLMHTILDDYHIHLSRVFITLRDGIFFGTLTFSHEGQIRIFDSRSSDAIALALHFDCPIFVENRLMEEAGRTIKQSNPSLEDRETDL